MAILETFTKRSKRLMKEQGTAEPDVFQYERLDQPFRVQVIHIWDSAIGRFATGDMWGQGASPSNQFWELIHRGLSREHGVFTLYDNYSPHDVQCKMYLIQAPTEGALDIIELSFRVIDRLVRQLDSYARQGATITQTADDAIEELNHRFREHGIGYQYEQGVLIRQDSQLTHSEIVKPALSLLSEQGFEGPLDEFVRAFTHYRHGRNKEAIAEALKAFESTAKAICAKRGWKHASNATAKPLLDVLFDNGLVPGELESHFSGLRSAMESGLPTLSNRTSRHGQGAAPTAVPDHFAAYALHLAASNIVFLIQAHRALK